MPEAPLKASFSWKPAFIAALLALVGLLPGLSQTLLPLFVFYVPLVLLMIVAELVQFVSALLSRERRWALSLAIAAPVFVGVFAAGAWANQEIRAHFPPDEGFWRSAVRSPSGDVTAIVSPRSEEAEDTDVLLAFHGMLPRAETLFTTEAEPGIGLAWTDEHHLVVGFAQGKIRPIDGLPDAGGIHIEYRTYQPDPSNVDPARAYQSDLKKVAYSFEEIDDPRTRQIQCVVRLTGTGGAPFDHVAVVVTGMGVGVPGDKYKSFGAVRIQFDFANAHDSDASLRNPTQAKLANVFPRNSAIVPPIYHDETISYLSLTADEARQAFATLRSETFDIRAVFGFDRIGALYQVHEPVSTDLLRRFNACSAKTNIYGVPFAVSDE